ncbi:MAG: hypothetical protein ACOYXT_25890 [Bacteroidota bacterium]
MIKNIVVLLAIAWIQTELKAQSTCYLPTPAGWESETFTFPIGFAPGIPFTGREEVRFSPGWGDTKSDELWSYCFVWWIKKDSKLDAQLLKKYLEEYYGGLVESNIESRKIDQAKVIPTVASFRENKEVPHSYRGTVTMLDYMSERSITLGISVHQQDCAATGYKAVFFAISPQPETHLIWQAMAKVWQGFQCTR